MGTTSNMDMDDAEWLRSIGLGMDDVIGDVIGYDGCAEHSSAERDALKEAEKSVQAANDTLDEIEAVLLKMKMYAERAADPTVSDAERRYLQAEVNSLKMELDNIGNNAVIPPPSFRARTS